MNKLIIILAIILSSCSKDYILHKKGSYKHHSIYDVPYRTWKVNSVIYISDTSKLYRCEVPGTEWELYFEEKEGIKQNSIIEIVTFNNEIYLKP